MFKPTFSVQIRPTKKQTGPEEIDERDWDEIRKTATHVVHEESEHLAKLLVTAYACKVAIDTASKIIVKHL